jgi:two-component system cell cycle response regulator DivK
VARILLVDDYPQNIALMVSLLRSLGHEPIAAASGALAVELAGRVPVDLVLLDIQMPDMDGFETAKELRKNPALAGVPFVAVTSLALQGERESILESGFSGYIAKPIDAALLPEQIAPFLRQLGAAQ